jgi:hypothetical protein
MVIDLEIISKEKFKAKVRAILECNYYFDVKMFFLYNPCFSQNFNLGKNILGWTH